jgi:ribosomal protein S18 acetylase RimI-like enzyme
MVTLADIRAASVAGQVHALQQAAYSVEAQRIGCRDFPPLRETLDALQGSSDRFLVFVEKGSIIGCLSYEWDGACAAITRLVVSPRHFRRGVASALLRTLESQLPVCSSIWAVTAELNEPAIRAYEKHGYQTASREISAEGIALRRLHKQLDAAR